MTCWKAVSVAGTNRAETGVHSWHVHRDPAAAAAACAEHLAARILAVLETRERCRVALPGGSTPAACLSHLATLSLPWNRVHWYLGDERCLPRGDTDRNDRMIEEHLWNAIAAPGGNIHRIPAELGAERAASLYADLIDALDRLDIVLLGMGEDGHTASLFPDNPALDDPASVVPVHHAPKPPPERVSLGIRTLRAAAERVVLATGSGKRDAIVKVKAGVSLPINRIGPLLWFVDRAAVD
jgi:6-phosphogluconolactonase